MPDGNALSLDFWTDFLNSDISETDTMIEFQKVKYEALLTIGI